MPDFTKVTTNPPAPIHHKFGCQWVMMNYSVVDTNFEYYNNFFKSSGSAFRLKPDHLRYFETTISKNQKSKILVYLLVQKEHLLLVVLTNL